MAARPGSVEEVRALVDETGIEFSFAQFVEMMGKPNAKLVPTTHLEDMFRDGAGFAGFATGELGQGPNDPDIAAMPDPASFTPVPWQPNLARFACDVFVESEPWPVEADGQVAQTRRAVRTIARIARTRGVRVVVIESAEQPRWRGVIEGDVAAAVARTLKRSGIEVEVLPATGSASKAPTDRDSHGKGGKASTTSSKP